MMNSDLRGTGFSYAQKNREGGSSIPSWSIFKLPQIEMPKLDLPQMPKVEQINLKETQS